MVETLTALEWIWWRSSGLCARSQVPRQVGYEKTQCARALTVMDKAIALWCGQKVLVRLQ